MICPKCEYEYIDEITDCPDCGTRLIPVDEFAGKLTTPADWVIIKTLSEEYEAQMLKDNLESGGISALILAQKDHVYPGVGGLAVVKLMVKKKDVTGAIALIENIYKGDSGIE
ncbi:MAG: hypothetical protein K9I69_01080 [Ignavibacteriales bacterium]|nr:hypothetical protein [Ignavibacteriales bacterium]MCF8305813.1 hypothetical protein [Ignavibacteriales bacterium]MCF8315535.1 hypothetical protein [Ignavibacteriales bacterium]MCF8436935.1 hypothetical protein [Ignavibacteriales bacterium]